GYAGASVTCPHCDQAAAYHGDRDRTLVSLCGAVRYTRAYYYCRRCGQGACPFDRQAAVPEHHLTAPVEPLASPAGGVAASFERGAELLEEMSGVRLSEATIARTTEDVGGRLADLLAQGVTFGPEVCWRWHHDAKGRTVAYTTVDATGTRQQG